VNGWVLAVVVVATVVASGAAGGLMGAWAAERRLGREWAEGTALDPLPVRDTLAADQGEAGNGA
jgi:hypothetical protein